MGIFKLSHQPEGAVDLKVEYLKKIAVKDELLLEYLAEFDERTFEMKRGVFFTERLLSVAKLYKLLSGADVNCPHYIYF